MNVKKWSRCLAIAGIGTLNNKWCHADEIGLEWLDPYNVVWTNQSKNAGESMPVSGGDIGLNVWVEDDELFFYIGRADCRDENGALLRLGRVRISLIPNPFEHGTFRQELRLRAGYVLINARLVPPEKSYLLAGKGL